MTQDALDVGAFQTSRLSVGAYQTHLIAPPTAPLVTVLFAPSVVTGPNVVPRNAALSTTRYAPTATTGKWLYPASVALVTTSPELVTNGTFATGITGWTDISELTGSIAWDGVGSIELTTPGGSNADEGIAYQSMTVEIGKAYRVRAEKSGGNSYFYAGNGALFAAPWGAYDDYLNSGNNTTDVDTVIVATTTTLFITLRNNNSATPALIDNVSVKELFVPTVSATTNIVMVRPVSGSLATAAFAPTVVTNTPQAIITSGTWSSEVTFARGDEYIVTLEGPAANAPAFRVGLTFRSPST